MTTHTDSFLWSKFIFVFEMCETTKKLENIWPRNITETKIMKYDENEKKSKIYHFFPNENSSEK